MKKMFGIIISVYLICLIFSGCQYNEKEIKLSSGSPGGTYYPIGGAIAQLMDDNIEGYSFTSYIGNEPVANTELIKAHGTDTALIQSNVAYWAYAGEGTFVDRPVDNLRGIASLYSEAIHIVVSAKSSIQDVYDLQNKKINIGSVESGTYIDALSVLDACDVVDYEAFHYNFNEAYEAMASGELDCIFITAGYPTSTVTSLISQLGAKLIPIPEAVITAVQEEQNYYTDAVIPNSTYPGIDKVIDTLAARALWVCDEELPDDLVYEMTKTLWEHIDVMAKAHEKGHDITFEDALEGMGIPLHNGAEQYYNDNKN